MSEKGNAILLRARQQFRQLRTVEGLKRIEVPEWECSIYYWPVRDLEERLAVEQHIRIGADRTFADLMRLHTAQVCYRARDEQGFRLFTDEDAKALADTAPKVVERVSSEMGLGDGLTLEEAEKN
jgi:hypothetical protein